MAFASTTSSRALALGLAFGLVGAACSSGDRRGAGADDGLTSITTVTASAGSESTSSSLPETSGEVFGETIEPVPDLTVAGDEVTGGCADVTADIAKATATIVILIDQSASMNDSLGAVSRWDAVRDVLFEPATSVIAPLQSGTKFGMTMYASNNGGPTCPILTEVPPAFDNLDAMSAAFTTPAPDGDTPTGDAVRRVAASLAALNDGTAKAIVLATDGEPDTCAIPDPQQGQPQSLAAVQQAYGMGISTFVISVGAEVSDQHLQQLANVGVGYDVIGDQQAPFFKTNNVAELANAFETLIKGFVPCSFSIDGKVEVDLACMGTVVLDGTELECGVDWDVPEASTLRLLGEACEALQDGQEHQVSATFPCPIINIP